MDTKPLKTLIRHAWSMNHAHFLGQPVEGMWGTLYQLAHNASKALDRAEAALAQNEINVAFNAKLDAITEDIYGTPGTREALRLADVLTENMLINVTEFRRAIITEGMRDMALAYRKKRGLP